MDESFGRDLDNHLLHGSYNGRFEFFAVSAPEPTGMLLVAGGGIMLLRRNRKKKI